ncbi:UDP-3-O-acyl-N-acetylglucosamine deacetylase, partial [Pelagibacteraceae bacterium]|nr:UDP-3-O-acyl-N-acetylglucosamine deacetylase [Pelagibacteraceae bacterium]
MSALNQKTLKKTIQIEGIGLHSGKMSKMTIHPAAPNCGIVFKRVDLPKNNCITPDIFNVSNATLCTTISNEFGVSVSTIEHLMGALFGKGVDNALIEIDCEEVPILDGSAKIFVDKIDSVGLEVSSEPIKIIKIEKKVIFNDGAKSISIEPNKISLDIDFEIKYDNLLIGSQKNKINVYESDLTDIYNSRTFCLYEDIDKLKKNFKNVFRLLPIEENFIDKIYKEKNKKTINSFYGLNKKITGESINSKISRVIKKIKSNNIENIFISSPENAAWLLNLRGKDGPNSPIPN